MDLHSYYKDKSDLYTQRIEDIRKKLILLSLLRLASFVAFSLCIFFLIAKFSYALAFGGFCMLFSFIFLVNYYFKWKEKRALLEKLLFVCENETALLNNEASAFDDGKTFLSGESYGDDLDVFGSRSLFHMLNRTTTVHGRETLAQLLKNSLQNHSEIDQYQRAIRSLAGEPEKRQLMTAEGLLKEEKEGNLYGLLEWVQSPTPLHEKKWPIVGRWFVLSYNIGCLLYLFYSGNYRPLLVGVIAGWIMTGLFANYIAKQHMLLGKKHGVLHQYQVILKIFSSIDSTDSEWLGQVQDKTRNAHESIRRLARLSNFFDQGLNFLVAFVLNNLFLYNLTCMIALERWKKKHKTFFPEWIAAVGTIELLNSLATFAFNNPQYIYPFPAPGESLILEASKMAHPLIPAFQRVPNDFSIGLEDRLILITGSNMSGKTTFLRTIGVNLLLAQCGAPVCAETFSFKPMRLLTSLRVSDSLQEQTSYFMAELKKLQQIIHSLDAGLPALVLIDEILRGTNSEDKTLGSEKFIRKLLQYSCLSLFASHDLSLGKMEDEKPGLVRNYCFESVIEAGELHFNYLLQRGIARNRNASFLMEKMEII